MIVVHLFMKNYKKLVHTLSFLQSRTLVFQEFKKCINKFYEVSRYDIISNVWSHETIWTRQNPGSNKQQTLCLTALWDYKMNVSWVDLFQLSSFYGRICYNEESLKISWTVTFLTKEWLKKMNYFNFTSFFGDFCLKVLEYSYCKAE